MFVNRFGVWLISPLNAIGYLEELNVIHDISQLIEVSPEMHQ